MLYENYYQMRNRFHILGKEGDKSSFSWTAYSMYDDIQPNFRDISAACFFFGLIMTLCAAGDVPDRFFGIEFGCVLLYMLKLQVTPLALTLETHCSSSCPRSYPHFRLSAPTLVYTYKLGAP